MKPVYQTILTPPHGNCYAACVASILEIPLDEVPPFATYDDWWPDYMAWLAERNLTAYHWDADGTYTPPGYAILAVKSACGSVEHAVVAYNGEVVHDPYPVPHQGLGERRGWTVFGLLDPSRPVGVQQPCRSASLSTTPTSSATCCT